MQCVRCRKEFEDDNSAFTFDLSKKRKFYKMIKMENLIIKGVCFSCKEEIQRNII